MVGILSSQGCALVLWDMCYKTGTYNPRHTAAAVAPFDGAVSALRCRLRKRLTGRRSWLLWVIWFFCGFRSAEWFDWSWPLGRRSNCLILLRKRRRRCWDLSTLKTIVSFWECSDSVVELIVFLCLCVVDCSLNLRWVSYLLNSYGGNYLLNLCGVSYLLNLCWINELLNLCGVCYL